MKRLFYLVATAIFHVASGQSFSVKNVNDDYFVTSIFNTDISKDEFHKYVRDKTGLYWFQYLTEVYSFDGANWKLHKLKTAGNNPFRINDIATTEDGNVWLATEHGIFVFDPHLESFISAREKFPAIKDMPAAVTCILQGPPGMLILIGFEVEGFFLFDWKDPKIHHVIIDKKKEAYVDTKWTQVVADGNGKIWGTTRDNRGIWNYDTKTGTMLCSWRGELPQFADRRFKRFMNLTYAKDENSLWITHGPGRYVEKMNLTTGKSNFYSFSGNLKVIVDTNIAGKHFLAPVKIDRENNKWINVGGQYLVRLDQDISKMEFLSHDWTSLPIGEIRLFQTETAIHDDRNNILLWITGFDRMSMIRKRDNIIRHVYFDTSSITGIKPNDYLNDGESRQNIFFEKGRNDQYFLLQKNAGRPKLICLDSDLRIKKAWLADEWKNYPAYFRAEFDPDTVYIAILRPGDEPLDFRNVVLKDFRIDIHTLNITEVKLDFKQRIWRYGSRDKDNVYWLFSNGFLYSYDPQKKDLDSIFISQPLTNGSNPRNMIKGYDYPTLLHKNSSTFWISFYPVRELYKINLESKRIEKVFKSCPDQKECDIPGAVYNMNTLDSNHIYLKSGLFGMLLNTKTDLITEFSKIVQKKLPAEKPVGVGKYGDWLYMVFPSTIYFINKTSGMQRQLLLGEDFKWKSTQFHSSPLVNDHGDMILMSWANKGFLIFNIELPLVRAKPGKVNYSFIKVDDRSLLMDSLIKNDGLVLKYNKYTRIEAGFSDYSIFVPGKTFYEYALYKGGDTTWNKIDGKPQLALSELSAGRYRLLLRASNIFGDFGTISAFNMLILPPYWQTWWFKGLILMGIGLIFYGVYRYRIQQLKKLQSIRNNIASDLHDDIGSTLNSISIYSEVAKQQAGKEIPAIDLIGTNSRKIIESMSDIVWAINPENDSFEKVIIRMRSFAHQLLKAKKVEYTFEVDEKLNSIVLPMQVRKNFYLVFKEAITNLTKYSAASRVSIFLTEENKKIILRIRDNGMGIPDNAEVRGNGLMNMKRRAEEIHAILTIHSAVGEGTGIELLLKT